MTQMKYEPYAHEPIHDYLKRLRLLAGKVQGRTVTLDQVAEMSQQIFSAPQQQLTGSWLSKAEAGKYNELGGDKLRSLAVIYSKLLRTKIQPEWLLLKAGFDLTDPIIIQVEDKTLETFLANENILGLVCICAKLIALDHETDVRGIAQSAKRLLLAYHPKADPGDLFDDPRLSAHARKYMEELEL
jgi:hypothetical protein